MNHRNLGNDPLCISDVGLGAWQLGADWGKVDDETAHAILQAAVDSGIARLPYPTGYSPVL